MKKLITFLTTLFIFAPLTFALAADAGITLRQVALGESQVSVSIHVANPSQQMVKSVQSWLKYDPSVLKGLSIDTNDSPFDFVAPGENNFDDTKGLVKIGRSTLEEGVNTQDIFIANVTFQRLTSAQTDISFFNFQVGNESNTSVRVFDGGFPVNILKKQPQVFTVAGDTPMQQETPTQVVVEPNETLPAIAYKQVPNFKVTTGPEYAVLAWDKMEGVSGYHVYYSTTSGRYIQRRSVGNTNEYYLDGLKTGDVYYFAVTAYDALKQESDYSQEVQVRVGYPDSSTAPLVFTKAKQMIEKTTQHVQTGPAETLFFLFILSGIVSFFFVKRRKV